MSNDLVKAQAAAQHLGLSPRTIYDWAAAGKIPCVRLGSVYRFDLGELDRWTQARHVGPVVPEAVK